MAVKRLALTSHLSLPKGVHDLLHHSAGVKDFISEFPTVEGFQALINRHDHPADRRKILSEALLRQNPEAHTNAIANIKSLADQKTFTVTTGHQLNIFTGPAFFIYKIAHTIKLARELSKEFPQNRFIPVFWMATEDHDLEEINHWHSFASTYRWDAQTAGAVGELKTDQLSDVLDEWLQELNRGEQHTSTDVLKVAAQKPTLTESTRYIANALFGTHGLVIIDASTPELKNCFKAVMIDELKHQHSSKSVEAQNAKLQAEGYPIQVNPREINLFYLSEGSRERITSDGHRITSLNGLDSNLSTIEDAVNEHPERFSPNVVLRPLYQEYLLPNLAYIGGPGEMSYWLQLKGVFDHYQVSFPILAQRNSVVVFSSRERELMSELNVSVEDLLGDEHQLYRSYVLDGDEKDPLFDEAADQLTELYNRIGVHLSGIDPTLEKRVSAVLAKQLKDLEGLEKSGVKALKQQHDVSLNRLKKLRAIIYPEGVFQERRVNYFVLSQRYRGDLIDDLIEGVNPFQSELLVFDGD